jgi:alginate O-acetyltransferase complex protein AlgI
MLFTEGRFFVLLAIAFSVYWALRSNTARKHWIFLCSCVFYGAWDWRFLILMFASIVADYAFGLILEREQPAHRKKLWVVLSVCANLGFLGYFKYYGFFVDSAVEFLQWLGFAPHPRTLEFILPAGISFYTFESMSYTIDVYRGRIKATRNLIDFAFFISFFPHLVAGPIVRAGDLLPQLETKRLWKDVRVRASLTLFLVGFFKKAVVADNFALPADLVFADPSGFSWAGNWTALLCYHVQIYCDFSGYSDMAIGSAGLFGYYLKPNFDFPYLMRAIGEWWRHWHISLTTWFRDYLYIPLGGNRVSKGRTYFNMYVVFVLCGLWHGADWAFIAFGLWHGTLLTGERIFAGSKLATTWVGRFLHVAGLPLTTLAVLVGWVFFRSGGVEKAGTMLGILGGLNDGGARELPWIWLAWMPVLLAVHVASRHRLVARHVDRAPDWAFAVGFGAVVALLLPFVAAGYKPFIYFQF